MQLRDLTAKNLRKEAERHTPKSLCKACGTSQTKLQNRFKQCFPDERERGRVWQQLCEPKKARTHRVEKKKKQPRSKCELAPTASARPLASQADMLPGPGAIENVIVVHDNGSVDVPNCPKYCANLAQHIWRSARQAGLDKDQIYTLAVLLRLSEGLAQPPTIICSDDKLHEVFLQFWEKYNPRTST